MEAGDGSCFQIKAGDTSEDAHHSAAIPLASPVSPIVEPQVSLATRGLAFTRTC